MSINDPIDFDLALAASVPLPEPIQNPENLRTATYRVTCKDVNPTILFPTCSYQTVTSISDTVAEITVTLSPPDSRNPSPESPRPSREAILSNRWLQSNHKTIIDFAESAVDKEVEPKAIALAIRNRVYNYLDKTESDQILASALVAATERKGDCTEHAMLVASACRAQKIPARVAIGLIYDEPSESMVYHMWTEVWTGNNWFPIDATRPHPHFVATRIKMSDENLNNVSDFGIVAPVIRAAGRVEVELVRAK